jgi:gliding motility-associated-like protein
VAIKDLNACTGSDTINVTLKECIKGFYIPNAFTPNNYLHNNIFKPLIFGRIGKYEFSVYNRWGQLIFKTNDFNKGWDGTFKGAIQETQVFMWICTYQLNGPPVKTQKGYVTLVK